MNNNYHNDTEHIQASPYLYAVINLGHSAISGMLAYKDTACLMPICVKSYPSVDIFHHGLLKNATAFREKIRTLLDDFETAISKHFKDRVELTKIYIGITPISMKLIDWTYTRETDAPEIITKGIMSALNEQCLDDFLKNQSKDPSKELVRISSLRPVYYTDKDFETPCTAASIDKLCKRSLTVKQQMLCVKEKYVKTIREQIQSMYQNKHLDIQFLSNPLTEAKLWEEQECQDHIYINVGAGSTTIFMTDKGVFYKMFIYPFGSASVTNDIQKYFSISNELAEHFKVSYSELEHIDVDGTIETTFNQEDVIWGNKSYSMSKVNKLIFVRMREILLNTKAYINKEYRKSQPNKIVFYGGGTKLNGFKELIKFLGFDFCDVEIIDNIEDKINQTLSNIHQVKWDNQVSNEHIFTLMSLINYVSSTDKYLNEEQGYSVNIKQALEVQELEYNVTPRKRKSTKVATPENETTSFIQGNIFQDTEESLTDSPLTSEIITTEQEATLKEEVKKEEGLFNEKLVAENNTTAKTFFKKKKNSSKESVESNNPEPKQEKTKATEEEVISSDDLLGFFS